MPGHFICEMLNADGISYNFFCLKRDASKYSINDRTLQKTTTPTLTLKPTYL